MANSGLVFDEENTKSIKNATSFGEMHAKMLRS